MLFYKRLENSNKNQKRKEIRVKTKLELQTAPESGVGSIGRLLVKCWEPLASSVSRKVEEICLKQGKKADMALILWRLTYNQHTETAEEFEEAEHSPIPLIYGKVCLVTSNTLWEISQFPYMIEFNSTGVLVHKEDGKFLTVSDAQLPSEIAKYLLQSK